MNKKQSKHELARVWPALAMMAIWLAGAAGGLAAEPLATPGTNADIAVVLDDTTLWRQFHVAGLLSIRGADGGLVRATVNWASWERTSGWDPANNSPLPSANWADPTFDDSAWPRFRLPQPVLPSTPLRHIGGGMGPRSFPYDTVVVLARGTFEVKNPTQIHACSLSVDYWGGVVVYLNGKEVVRGHLATNQTNLADAVPQDYPEEAYLSPEGKPMSTVDGKNQDRLALRDRKLRDVKIPAALLRQGVNVLAIEVHAAPIPSKALVDRVYSSQGEWEWPPIGLLSARLIVSPSGAAVGNRLRPGGVQVWNSGISETVTAFDYGAPAEPLRPIEIRAARNSVFSGRLMVGSDQSIKGLKVNATDLALVGPSLVEGRQGPPASASVGLRRDESDGPTKSGDKIPSAAVRIRYAEPAVAAKSWVPGGRFDGLLDAIPAEIPLVDVPPASWTFYHRRMDRRALAAGAVAPLWFTVRVPADVKPGVYEGTVSVLADGLKPVKVPLRVIVSAWAMPDPEKFRAQNFICHAEEVEARYYGVARWSDKHFELIGKSLALMAEVNSRQVYANLAVDFFGPGSNPESLVRWVKQPDGSFKHDFTIFDKYLDMVAKYVGKPRPLRLNCWGSPAPGLESCATTVSAFDPATGKVGVMPQPLPGTAESLAFWQPVFDEILKKLKARGWLDAATFGYNSYNSVPPPALVDVAAKLWPEGAWSFASHAGQARMKFVGSATNVVMIVRQSTGVWDCEPSDNGQAMPRRDTFCKATRAGGGMDCFFNDFSPPSDHRTVVEDVVKAGFDGLCEFGVDLFPLKTPSGGYACLPHGRGLNWAALGRSTLAILAPGPDGPVATERFEMFREGLELTEALLFVEHAFAQGKISADLQKQARSVLDARRRAFERGWFGFRHMQSDYDQKLLDIAGEVARELGKK
jgi:hypothetical protein